MLLLASLCAACLPAALLTSAARLSDSTLCVSARLLRTCGCVQGNQLSCEQHVGVQLLR